MAYLTAASAKERDPRLADYTDAAVDAHLAAFREIAERYRGVAYETTTSTIVATDWVGDRLRLPVARATAITAATVGGTALSGDDVAALVVVAPWVERHVGWASANCLDPRVALTVTHGYASPPAALLDAATEYVLCVLRARASGVSRNTLSEATEAGTTRYSTPDWSAGRPTGWLEVDRLLNSLPDYRTPGMA